MSKSPKVFGKLFGAWIFQKYISKKVKSFAWKASKNILATKANLWRRHIIADLVCEARGVESESSSHALWDCEKAQEVWRISGLSFDAHDLVFPEFIEFLWHLKFGKCMGDDVLEFVIMVAWCVWYNRNAVHQGKERQACEAILHKAKIMLEEFQMANFSMAQPWPQDDVYWEALEPYWYKINVDETVFVGYTQLVWGQLYEIRKEE